MDHKSNRRSASPAFASSVSYIPDKAPPATGKTSRNLSPAFARPSGEPPAELRRQRTKKPVPHLTN